MENQERKKHLMQLIVAFNGPIHQAFVYIYYQTYIQETDMYNFIIACGLRDGFTSKELHVLENERRPSHFSLPLLFKVLKMCCTPPLAHCDHTIWKSNVEKFSLDTPIETIITSITNMYSHFLMTADSISQEECYKTVDVLEDASCLLIQKSSLYSKFTRWTEERDRLQRLFADIRNSNFSAVKSPFELVEMETHFRADVCEMFLKDELDVFSFDLKPLRVNQEEDQFDQEHKNSEDTSWRMGHFLKGDGWRGKTVWISGDHGIGKSSLASSLILSWKSRCFGVTSLHNFKIVTAMSISLATTLPSGGLFAIAFPLSSAFIDIKETMTAYLLEREVVIILDDVQHANKDVIRQIYLQSMTASNLTVWFLGRCKSITKYFEDNSFASDSLFLRLNGLRMDKVLELCNDWTEKLAETEIPSLRTVVEDNINRLSRILKYPAVLLEVCDEWIYGFSSLKEVFTCSDLFWQLLALRVKRILKINIKHNGPMRKKFLKWFSFLGELSLCHIKQDCHLDSVALEELCSEITTLFPQNGQTYVGSLFCSSISHSSISCRGPPSSSNVPFLEFCCSWYLIEQLLANKRMGDLTDGVVDILPLVVMAAGHIERLQEERNINPCDQRKLLKTLINYKEGSFEDFSFIQELVVELKCVKKLVEMVIDETEYDEEWNLDVSLVQQKALEALLSHVSPKRLIFLIDESCENHELTAVLNFICRVDISIWLDSVGQFRYGNAERMDHLLKPFLEQRVTPKVDLISGSLSPSLMKELPKMPATRHLVFLRLKVGDVKSLFSALSLPKELPLLLWLEIKLDMELIPASEVASTKVELFDIHLGGLRDDDVPNLADFLSTVHLRYTGIHLDNTTLTPEGVFALLLQLKKKGVLLKVEEEAINKFRRWYYPSLSEIAPNSSLSEEEYVQLIGHDDRNFYSAHHVVSSQFVTVIDAWNLRNFLENEEGITHFTYEANNIIFSKKLNGIVEISFKGNYKEIMEEKVIQRDSNAENQSNDLASKIIDIY